MKFHRISKSWLIAAGLCIFSFPLFANMPTAFQTEVMELSPKEIIEKMEKATDPQNKYDTVTSVITKTKLFLAEEKIKGTITIKYVPPNKIRVDTIIEDIGNTIKVYDGKQAWEWSAIQGVRPIKNAELEDLQFSLALQCPKVKLADLYSSFVFGKCKTPDEDKKYFCIVCTPDAKRFPSLKPTTYYIDRNSFLVAKEIGISITDGGEIPGETENLEYKEMSGIMTPVKLKQISEGSTAELSLDSQEFDKSIDESEFKKPIDNI